MAALIWAAGVLMVALALVLAWLRWQAQDAERERIRQAGERVNDRAKLR